MTVPPRPADRLPRAPGPGPARRTAPWRLLVLLALAPLLAVASGPGIARAQDGSTPAAVTTTTTTAIPGGPIAPGTVAPDPVRPVAGVRGNQIRPYGANLFDVPIPRSPGPNANYLIQPGDVIQVRLYGAVEQEQVEEVDPNGAVFVQRVGAVQVAGLPVAQLNERLQREVSRVYTDEVRVYAVLRTAQTIGIFVTGEVLRPGRYLGVPDDSVLFFLSEAAGINPETGSYRDVQVLRGEQVVAQVDLYEFLMRGRLPRVQFREGDTVLVKRRGNVVTVDGAVAHRAQFEFVGPALTGDEVMTLARPSQLAAHVSLTGARHGAPFNDYLPLDVFRGVEVRDGDSLVFRADTLADTILVNVEGPTSGPGAFNVLRDARLTEVLDLIPVDRDIVELTGIHIRRRSVAAAQKKSLDDALVRLERNALTALSATEGVAEIRVAEAQLIQRFVESARQITPDGRVVVAPDGLVKPIPLEDGDVIVIPPKTAVVRISGEVILPQAIAWSPELEIRDYVEQAGGYAERANDDDAVVVRLNGSVATGLSTPIRPGDEILILPEADFKGLQVAKDVSTVLFQAATSAAAVVRVFE